MLPQGGVPPPASRMHVPQALPYVALLIVMLFFIYAVIGMQVGWTPGPQPTSPDSPLLGSERSPEWNSSPHPHAVPWVHSSETLSPHGPRPRFRFYREKLPQVTQ